MEIWEASATLAFIPIMILTRFVMIIGMMENTIVIVFSCHDIDTFVVLILMMVVVVMENIMMTSSLSML